MASVPSRSTWPNVPECIGNTPLMNIEDIWVKLEFLNPSGSIKDRIARYMIERAEEAGLLRPGDTIVEASSGNTGNALSMVAAVKGYRMVVVMPRGMSEARTAISRAFGAEVVHVRDFHVNEALRAAKEMGGRPGYFCPGQFESEWNVEENREWLGPEILSQLPDGRRPDSLVMGVGTGGTLIGVGQAFRSVNRGCRLVAVEPHESCTILCGETGRHKIEGISDGFVPTIFRRYEAMVDDVLSIPSGEALDAMSRIARDYGLFVGPSSGAHLAAAKRIKEQNPEPATIVTVFCDEGEKYLSEHFSTDERRVEFETEAAMERVISTGRSSS